MLSAVYSNGIRVSSEDKAGWEGLCTLNAVVVKDAARKLAGRIIHVHGYCLRSLQRNMRCLHNAVPSAHAVDPQEVSLVDNTVILLKFTKLMAVEPISLQRPQVSTCRNTINLFIEV